MSKIKGSDHFFTFPSSFLRCCFLLVAIGPINYHTTVATSIVTSVLSNFTGAHCPLWVETMKSVVFLDTTMKKLIKYQPGSTAPVVVQLQDVDFLGFLVPVKSNPTKFAIGFGKGIGVFAWDGTTTTAITPENYLSINEDNTRLEETVRCGTSYKENATDYGMLYSIDKSGTVTVKLTGIGLPMGIAWSADNKQLYYADTTKNTIVSIGFNKDTGDLIGDGQDVFDFTTENITEPAEPSGMTVDTDGYLWVAIWQKTYVMKIDLTAKTVLSKVDFPENNVMRSVGFVGPTSEDMYATSTDTLFHVTKTGSKGISAFELEENWPMKKPPPPPPSS